MGRSNRPRRRAYLELCEQRVVMTGMPVADFMLERVEPPPLVHFAELQPQLGDVHALTGLEQVRSTYGFRGAGQTVAVIDSGIAWDHWALGRGIGAGYRVVGGWDFTEENDANPYDDGPAGFHGTHVAGIIGSSDARYSGVAPEVDLVALRVFNDQGMGYFDWVEKALRWVHQHRLSFENPITVVNLSLGSTWNASQVPGWSQLEDEFAQLKADGIFISVAAGNAFQQYAAAGLSYPAASPHVVPVSSVTDTGTFSSFSQRHARALAAPGQAITSTVPDHVYGVDGVANDFGAASGTSMAAPYVAGAAVLVREAMQFVGMTGITQDTIYEHLRSTADVFYDAATKANYFRIHVGRAIDALMPEDDYGSTLDTSWQLGELQTQSLAGTISHLRDADYFTFTAQVSGTMHLKLTGAGNLAANVAVVGAQASAADGRTSFTVQAGQTYTFAVTAGERIGRYAVDLQIESSVQVIDWGAVDYQWRRGVDLGGAADLYKVTATRSGILSIEAFSAASAGSPVQLEWVTAAGQVLGSSTRSEQSARLDLRVESGGEYFVRAAGVHENLDLRLANILQIEGSRLTVFGSAEADMIRYTESTGEVVVRGIAYRTGQQPISEIRFAAGAGHDQVQVTLDASSHVQAELRSGATRVMAGGRTIHVTSAEEVTVQRIGGSGSALLVDTAADDELTVTTSYAEMIGGGVRHRVEGFASISATAWAGGVDSARVDDSSANDTITATPQAFQMRGGGRDVQLDGFERLTVSGGAGGHDTAWLYGSAGTDRLTIRPASASFTGDGFAFALTGIEQIRAVAGAGGEDRAALYDTAGDDRLEARPHRVLLEGSNYLAYAEGFQRTDVFAHAGGHDTAVLFDSAGNDRFQATPDSGSMEGDGYRVTASGFDALTGHARGGRDVAQLFDSRGDDVLRAYATHSVLAGARYRNEAVGFDRVNITASQGSDRAEFFAASGPDRFFARPQYAYAQGADYYNFARGFHVQVVSSGQIGAEAAPSAANFHNAPNSLATAVRPLSASVQLGSEEFVTLLVSTRGDLDRARYFDRLGSEQMTPWSDGMVPQRSVALEAAQDLAEYLARLRRSCSVSVEAWDEVISQLD